MVRKGLPSPVNRTFQKPFEQLSAIQLVTSSFGTSAWECAASIQFGEQKFFAADRRRLLHRAPPRSV